MKPALKSVNESRLSQSLCECLSYFYEKLIAVLHILVKHHLTCSFTMGLTILHVACIVCIMGKAYVWWAEDRALSG